MPIYVNTQSDYFEPFTLLNFRVLTLTMLERN